MECLLQCIVPTMLSVTKISLTVVATVFDAAYTMLKLLLVPYLKSLYNHSPFSFSSAAVWEELLNFCAHKWIILDTLLFVILFNVCFNSSNLSSVYFGISSCCRRQKSIRKCANWCWFFLWIEYWRSCLVYWLSIRLMIFIHKLTHDLTLSYQTFL